MNTIFHLAKKCPIGIWMLFFLIGCIPLGCLEPASSFPSLLIQDVHVWDAVSGLRKHQSVLLEGNTITAVGDIGTISLPRNTEQINGEGKYLIPGLWDAHVHLIFDKAVSPAMFDLFIYNGITSVRDTGGHLEEVLPWRNKARQNPDKYPRMMVAGPLIDGRNRVYDGSSVFNPDLAVGISTEDEAVAVVETMDSASVDLLKAYEMLSPEVFHTILKEAEKKGYVVTGHVPLSMDVTEASHAGLRSMEHLRNMSMACSESWQELLTERQELLAEGKNTAGAILRRNLHSRQRYRALASQDSLRTQEVLSVLAANQTWQIPTAALNTSSIDRLYAQEGWQENFAFLPTEARDKWLENAQRFAENPVDSNRVNYANWTLDMIKKINDADIGLMAGTDTPIFYLTPGFSLHEELERFVRAGLSPEEALEAATLRPAQYFEMEGELGSISSGKIADLVLLNANPLENIRNTTNIAAVVKNGNYMDRAELDELGDRLKGVE
ncbi:MAG: amidohydrolase family protein [Bacteroidota bacterium]